MQEGSCPRLYVPLEAFHVGAGPLKTVAKAAVTAELLCAWGRHNEVLWDSFNFQRARRIQVHLEKKNTEKCFFL